MFFYYYYYYYARYRGYEIFNKLNRDIRNETQLSKYKRKIRDSIAHSAQVRYQMRQNELKQGGEGFSRK